MAHGRRIVKTDRAHAAMLDDALVVLHPDSGQFFSLEGTGLVIWRMLDEEGDVDRIVQSLADEYEIDAESCREEVDRFANQLVAAGFAEIR